MSEERVQKLEELVSFADQRTDCLDEAIRDVASRLGGMMQRLERLESRLRVLESAGEDAEDSRDPAVDDRPPHSGRLPGDR